eukprot:COSAG02_NODE_12811_length_1488_cov_2.485961_1_plen_140_part_00
MRRSGNAPEVDAESSEEEGSTESEDDSDSSSGRVARDKLEGVNMPMSTGSRSTSGWRVEAGVSALPYRVGTPQLFTAAIWVVLQPTARTHQSNWWRPPTASTCVGHARRMPGCRCGAAWHGWRHHSDMPAMSIDSRTSG